ANSKKLFIMAMVTQFRGQRWGSMVEDILILRLNTTTTNSSKMSFGYDSILTIYNIGKSLRKLL
ncbi:MAG: hypothetical protein QOK81_04685, partial [Nitrososphaeraceae archaeon]|nr:hypothetical protein [Nitrososphaeraceae archaeon]